MIRPLFLLGLLAVAPPLAASDPVKRVFVLNSYRSGFQWTDNQVRGIHTALENGSFEVQTWVESMYSVRDPLAEEKFRQRYRQTYADQHFDLVVTTDDEALELVASDPALFPGTPVVFGGVSDRSLVASLPRERFTGVMEVFPEMTMLDLALQIHPNTKRVYLVADGITGSKQFVTSFQHRAEGATWKLEVLSSENQTFDGIIQRLGQLGSGDLVFVASLFRDKSGAYLASAIHYPQLAAAAPVPVYGLAHTIGQGFLAGTANTGVNHGVRTGELGLRILSGASPAAVPIVEDKENLASSLFGVGSVFPVLGENEGGAAFGRPPLRP